MLRRLRRPTHALSHADTCRYRIRCRINLHCSGRMVGRIYTDSHQGPSEGGGAEDRDAFSRAGVAPEGVGGPSRRPRRGSDTRYRSQAI
jgi:hypothetical protein